MTEQLAEKSVESYCEVCGIAVRRDTDLKRFGKFFCSNEHIETYVKAKQIELGLGEEEQQEHHERGRERRRWFGGGCC